MMLAVQSDADIRRRDRNGALLSAGVHALVLLAIVGALHRTVKIEPYRLPETRDGVPLLKFYAPRSSQAAKGVVAMKTAPHSKAVPTLRPAVEPPKVESASVASADRGVASSPESGLGDGNITIALQKYFPYPKPSLTSLPQGTAGDVILKAVIDEHGKITELTLVAGLGPAIDNEVIQTVNQWVYTPATKDGVPVPSVEELHFHYERG